MADDPNKAKEEAAKKHLAEQRKAREEAQASAPPEGKPTPTQEEIDMARLGVHITEHEDDGSGPDPNNQPLGPFGRNTEQKQSTAKPQQGRGYETRAVPPKPPTPPTS
jgi:hypothetical protein